MVLWVAKQKSVLKEIGKTFWEGLNRDNLHKRIFKCVLATTITVIITLLPNIRNVYGTAAYLASITSVFGHPGRRLGGMIEALSFALVGASLGIGWASLGTFLGSLVSDTNATASMGVKATFLIIASFVHGYFRSAVPRLFTMVLLFIIPTIIGLTSPTLELTSTFPVQFFYPILTSIAVLLAVNLFVFPEFGFTYLGLTTIETLQQTIIILSDATHYFVESSLQKRKAAALELPLAYSQTHTQLNKVMNLEDLTSSKATLREKLSECKNVYSECSFELAVAVLAPKELKPIAGECLTRLVMNTMALVGACESKYALMGSGEGGSATETEQSPDETPRDSVDQAEGLVREVRTKKEKEKEKKKDKEDILRGMKVKREIEFGDQQLLRDLLRRVEEPLHKLQLTIDRSVDIVNTCIAYAYDVATLPSLKQGTGKARRPRGILLQELDIHIDWLTNAIEDFGKKSTEALEGTAEIQGYNSMVSMDLDIMPREEVFLISSFIMNLRQAASHTLEMLRWARHLVELRQERKDRKRLFLPEFNVRKWLFSGNEENEVVSATSVETALREQVDDEDEYPGDSRESLVSKAKSQNSSKWEWLQKIIRRADRKDETGKRSDSKALRFREAIADFLKWVYTSDSVLYAFKLTIGIMLCSWPAFVADYTRWYNQARGVWVPFIFVLVFENAVGSTVWIFFLRSVGTILGSVWGYAAYEAGKGNEYVIAVMIMLGIIPAFYVQLGTPYTKAGMVATISMCVVSISTHLQTVPGTSFENFYKRTTAMMIGGGIALLIQLLIYPVKARVKLKESLAVALAQLIAMETCIALGVDRENIHMLNSPKILKHFNRSRKKAEAALTAAETYLIYTRQEPRLKGDFTPRAVVYKEVIFVLRQIVDRMENLLQLRIAYGSAVLEQFNARVHSYRRNVAAAITLTLYTVSQALMIKLPLPQFLPSARLAHVRMVVRVRQLLQEETDAETRHQQQAIPTNNTNTPDIEHTEILHPTNNTTNTQPTEDTSIATAANSARKRALRLKFLSWNAASAALEECVEYVEELVDLTKLLVGVNEFRSGLLYRPTFQEYLDDIHIHRSGIKRDLSCNTADDAQPTITSSTGGDAGGADTATTHYSLERLSTRLSRRFMSHAPSTNAGDIEANPGAIHRSPETQPSASSPLPPPPAGVLQNGDTGQQGHTTNVTAATGNSSESPLSFIPSPTLPNPLQRIQSRRVAERVRRNSELQQHHNMENEGGRGGGDRREASGGERKLKGE